MNQLTIPLEEDSGIPLYTQIYAFIRREIKDGRISSYSRLPSTRRLSASLGVSRSTVQMAYDQLLAEGYLDAEPCRGYYAADMSGVVSFSSSEMPLSGKQAETGLLSGSETAGKAQEGIGAGGQSKTEIASLLCDFSPAGVDLSCFPYKTWRRLTREVFSDETGRILGKGQPQGEPGLRLAIRDYLQGARGVFCEPDQIVVGAGNEYLLMLLSQILGRTRPIAMEDPTYYQAYRVMTALGHTVRPVSLDGQGIEMGELERTGAGLAYVMPSHQYPTGIVMPIARRLELLNWAERKEAYLIEDDYDSEFRYRGRPIPSLLSVDRNGRVIYLGTFSRAIAPAIRVSFLVLPGELAARYQEVCGFYACTVPRADQEVLTRFLSGGSFERHLNRMRGVYREKVERLTELLRPLEDDFRIHGAEAGVHVLITSRRGMSETDMLSRAEREGVRVYGLSRHFIRQEAAFSGPGTVMAGFAGVKTGEMERGAEALLRAWNFTEF